MKPLPGDQRHRLLVNGDTFGLGHEMTQSAPIVTYGVARHPVWVIRKHLGFQGRVGIPANHCLLPPQVIHV